MATTTIHSLVYKITADTKQFSSGVALTRKEITATKAIMESTRSPASRLQQALDGVRRLYEKGAISAKQYAQATRRVVSENVNLTNALGPLGAGLAKIFSAFALIQGAKGIVGLAASAEQSRIAFENMTGSAETAAELLHQITAFSAKTPFEPGELRSAAQQLLAFSISADQVLPTLKTLGDLSAGTNRNMSEFVNILGKVKDRGRISAETLNEFGLRSVPLTRALAETMGQTREEIQKLASQGKIGFEEMMTALKFLTSEGQLFHDAMRKQSESLFGIWSTLTGNIKILGENLGKILIPHLKAAATSINRMLEAIQQMDSLTKASYITFGLWVAGIAVGVRVIRTIISVVQALIVAYRALATAQIIQLSLQGPKGWAVLATAAVVAGVAIGATVGAINNQIQAVEKANAASERQAAAAEKTTKAITAQTAATERQKQSVTTLADEINKARQTAFEKMLEEGRGITEQFASPFEKARMEIEKLNDHLTTGTISWGIYQKAVAKVKEQLLGAGAAGQRAAGQITARTFGPAERGSQEAFKTIVEAQLRGTEDQGKQMLDVEKRQLAALDELVVIQREPHRVQIPKIAHFGS